MAGMNSQIHLTIDTITLNRLQSEAVDMEISVSELIRRKIADPPTDEEIRKERLGNKENDEDMLRLVQEESNESKSQG